MQNEPSKRVRVKKHPGIYYREGKRGRRYMFPYRDSDGRQRWKSVEGKLEDALDERNAMRRKLRGGEVVRPSESHRLTFEDAAREFLVAKKPGLSERTHETYKLQLERAFAFIGERFVASLRREDMAELVSGLLAKGYSPQTVKTTLTPVSRVFDYARVPNPVKALDRDERPKPEPREQRILSKAEIQKLFSACSDTYRPVIQTAIFTGMRQMELLGLTWADVDFETQTIRVREQLSRSGGRKALKTKGKGRRDVDVPPFLVQMLREHKAASPFSQDTDYVFTTGSGKPFGWSNVDRQGLHKASERAKLRAPRPRFHDLRHTFVSILIGQGQPVSYVADQVGDSVETTLRTYAHLFDKAAHSEKSRAAMEAAFGNSVVTGASETSETPKRAAVVDIASKQGNR